MLDRIKQMAEEAGLSQRYGDDIPEGDDVVIADQVTMAEVMRFAQIVAKDCAKTVNDELTKGRSPMGKVAADAIRARYGIKE